MLWGEVNAGSNRDVSSRVVVSAAEVIDTIHDGAQVIAVFPMTKDQQPARVFVIFEHKDGREYIDFDDASSPGRNLRDMDNLDD